ncbi:hypothetical protein [Streptomyces sp. Root1310]|uniref:hypothetical protein n=1 Tax=Streptomyces sp. Root1310 TaxID=1736452 RepID=UPI000710E46B|nr:hypothetical protein [Streptomyces sp. Root1310]KQX72219.1 hypothetical protein ASD48_39835 [Streptomyces sp. Root1310]
MVQIPVDMSQDRGHGLLRQTHEAVREASATVDLPFGLLAETVLGRSGDAGFFRYALGHAALRLHGVTGWALDRQRDDALAATQASSGTPSATPRCACTG